MTTVSGLAEGGSCFPGEGRYASSAPTSCRRTGTRTGTGGSASGRRRTIGLLPGRQAYNALVLGWPELARLAREGLPVGGQLFADVREGRERE